MRTGCKKGSFTVRFLNRIVMSQAVQGGFFEAVLILALFFSFLFHSPFRLWENTAGKPNAADGG